MKKNNKTMEQEKAQKKVEQEKAQKKVEQEKAREKVEQEKAQKKVEQEKAQNKVEQEKAQKKVEQEKAQNKVEQEKAPIKKLTDAERKALALHVKETATHHRCQAVPFNQTEWAAGLVVGVIEEKRANKVLVAIRLDDGRRIVKVWGSEGLKVFDEKAEAPHRGREKKAFEPWTEEALRDEMDKYIANVGLRVTFRAYGTGVTREGRIMAIVPDKRVNMLLYRIDCGGSYLNKNVKDQSLVMGEVDADYNAINARYAARRGALAARVPLTPQDRVVACQEAVEKAKEQLAQAQARLDARTAQLAQAQAELAAYLDREAGK